MSIDAIVALEKCAGYSTELRGALDRLLSNLGGIGRFVRAGQSVVVKPNLLSDYTPDEAVTTHPEVVRHIVRILREHGAKVSVADSPANVVKLERVWERTGFRAMCDEEGAPLLNVEEAGSETFSVDGISFSIARTFLDADVVVNVPKIKTHTLTTLTAAVKNMYGTVPGLQKGMLHKMFPRPHDFRKIMTAIFERVPPALTIADGILGMEGEGPSAGKPIQLGFLAASSDAVALDLTLCDVLRIKPQAVPYLLPYLKGDKQRVIKAVGADIAQIAPKSFQAPSTLRARLIPRTLVRILEPLIWIRPSISDKCVFCGRCVKACPASALSMTDRRKPVLDPRKCIGCCCCHEVCPEQAISMTQSPFLRFIRKGNMP